MAPAICQDPCVPGPASVGGPWVRAVFVGLTQVLLLAGGPTEGGRPAAPHGPNLKVDGTARTPRGQDRVCRSHSEARDTQAIWGGLSGERGPRFGFVVIGGQVWAQGCRAGWAVVACSPPASGFLLASPAVG